MASRLKLHEDLLEIVDNVYFQPPESTKMKYDAIIYDFSTMSTRAADNLSGYLRTKGYDVTVISKNSDNGIVDKLLDKFQYIRFNRRYKTDNLYHDVLTLYY